MKFEILFHLKVCWDRGDCTCLSNTSRANGTNADNPHELAPIVRQRAERYYNVVQFSKFPEGGHFAIHERAEEMAADLRRFFRPLRKTKSA